MRRNKASWLRFAQILCFGLSVFGFHPRPCLALNPDRHISQFAHNAWRIQDGFLGATPWMITQTTDGFIWVGTQGGPLRFDGVQSNTWVPPGASQIRSSIVVSVLGTGREAISNAFQHAAAAKIEVELTYSQAVVRLRIRDDDKGISQAVLDKGRDGHWGLAGMRERPRRIGARFSIWSNTGAGTEIELEIPARIAYLRERSRWFRKNSSTEEV